MTFAGLELSPAAALALAGWGITTPTPVQAEGIAPILEGRHVVLHAGTGTGKTLAFVLPALQRLQDPAGGRVVVVAPGAELAMQTLRVAKACGAADAAAAISTTSRRRERDRLTKGTRLVVGTPDRLGALFAEGKLKGVGLLVLDELEPILATPAAGFLPELIRRTSCQVVVASATLGPRSEAFVAQQLPLAVRVRPVEVDRVRHHSVLLGGRAPDVVLGRFVEEQKIRRAIAFANDPTQQHHLARFLEAHRIGAVIVGREGSKAQRQQGLERFRSGAARVLLTSDAVARGLDLPEVDWVLHVDLPRGPEAYVHRAGRTGRAGRAGDSVVFVEVGDLPVLRTIARATGRTFTPWA